MYLEILRHAWNKDGALHHATLIQGAKERVLQPLMSFIKDDIGFSISGNPDFQLLEFDSFGIADGRVLQERSQQRALKERKIFVATFNGMTLEAQNALLKLFEEPIEDTHFFLITENIDNLLKTLRSRMFVLDAGAIVESDIAKRAERFLQLGAKERIVELKDIVEEKDKALGLAFLNALESHLYKDMHKSKKSLDITALKDISQAKQYIKDRGSSVKLLLEHLALTLPKV
jgi:DNA polymerase III delta prime subunit